MLEIAKAYPFAFAFLVGLPFMLGIFSGAIGAYSGYDNLKQRQESNQEKQEDKRHHARLEEFISQHKDQVGVIRHYETQLAHVQGNTDVLRRIIEQYDQLNEAIANHEMFTGQQQAKDRIAASEQIIDNLKYLLGTTKIISENDRPALAINVAPNLFRVILSVPMRIPPHLEFRDIPAGIHPNVIEKTNVGFTVVFVPQTTPVTSFGFIANADL